MSKQAMNVQDEVTVAGPATSDIRRKALERRLDDGYVRIDEAALSGADVAEWESFWIRLLREYEDLCRELDVAA